MVKEIIEAAIDMLKKILGILEKEQDREQPDIAPGDDSKPYEIPKIKVHDIEVKTRGKYVGGGPRGLVVHFTAGWANKGETSAVNTLRDLAKRGLGCMVMDTDGVIHIARTQADHKQWAHHAGTSSWKGVSSLSKYLEGMEICNGGKLEDNGKTWFGYKPKNTRTVTAKDNVKAGTYEAYTKEQEKSLINYCLWKLDTDSNYGLEWVVGHDEIAPSRKNDPGGALSKTMPEFRDHLRKLM